jgi:hypothetical protein
MVAMAKMERRLTRSSKIAKILALMQEHPELPLTEAAKVAYGSNSRQAREKTIRLLSVYRLRGKANLRVRDGMIVEN